MSELKKGAEAKQEVEGFAKKGKVKTFVCGAAKMLKENADYIQAGIGIGTIVAGTGIAAAPVAVPIVAAVAGFGVAATGLAVVVDVLVKEADNKPILLENLVSGASKKINNFANKIMEKGGR